MSRLTNVRPICRGWLTFALGPATRPCDRSSYTSTPSGRSPEPPTSTAFGRQPCFAKSGAFVTLMSSRRILRSVASGPVRRVAAPAGCRSIHGAILRRRIRLLVSLASRLVNPRTASPRLTPPAAPNLHRSRTQTLRLRLSICLPRPSVDQSCEEFGKIQDE